MPYIKNSDRGQFDEMLVLLGDRIETAGEFNYIITRLAHKYIENNGECYQNYNDIVGVLESAKMELYRKKIAPYEDIKEKENPL
jgi:hypothetical protein